MVMARLWSKYACLTLDNRTHESPIGWMPHYEDIDWRGIDFTKEQWDELMAIDRDKLKMQTLQHEELFLQLFDRLPKEMIFLRELLIGSY